MTIHVETIHELSLHVICNACKLMNQVLNDTMKIKMIFHGSLKKYNSDRAETELEISGGMMVGDLIPTINVPSEEIAFVAVNGSRAAFDTVIQDGDEVKLFQMVGGG